MHPYPWGKSVTHKGVDIFAKAGTPIHPSTPGLVVYTGEIERGGNVVLVLGPKWRLHYYAHLQQIETRSLAIVGKHNEIGNPRSSFFCFLCLVVSGVLFVWSLFFF